MKLTNLLIAASTAMLVVGCSDKNDPNLPEPTPGVDVVFGAALEAEPQTRTIYGQETNNQFPILWLNGDEVKVMSPECQIQQGTYAVNLGTTAGGEEAGTLVKQGDAGVQWGDAATADFFSVYPAQHVTEMNPANRTVKCHFVHNQNDYIHQIESGKYIVLADMKAGFLYASTYGAEAGKSVNLNYKPISTALRFTLRGPTKEGADPVQVQRVVLKAPSNQPIAGDFTLTFPAESNGEPTITMPATVDGSTGHNQINITAPYEEGVGSGFVELGVGQSIELNAFLLLDKNVVLDNNWSIQVILSNGTTLTKNLGNTETGTTAESKTLVKGKINRFKADALPALDLPSGSDEYDPSNWMVNIPRNTYLCEVSIPGSWNSLNSDFQSDIDLKNQYAAGCRAFHLDTRWKSDASTLGVAAGGSGDAYGGSWTGSGLGARGKYTTSNAFSTFLSTITDQVKANEYMVVFCTFAQNSATPSSGKTWEQAVSEACAANGDVYDASQITPTTTVGEVLGKVIVIVNSEGSVPTIQGSKCFFVNAPLKLKSSMFNPVTYGKNLLYYGSNTSSGITLLTSQCQIEYQSHSVYTGQGEDSDNRGYLPTPANRKAQAAAVMKWSLDNYVANKNNMITSNWLYLGLGGYRGAYGGLSGNVNAVSDSYTTVASTYNTWIMNDIVGKMSTNPSTAAGTTGFYPVGIVLMNFVTNETYGKPALNAILQLNGRFEKNFDDSKPAWPTTQQNSPANYSSSHTVAGNAWTVNQ